jgi:hypothetical protein
MYIWVIWNDYAYYYYRPLFQYLIGLSFSSGGYGAIIPNHNNPNIINTIISMLISYHKMLKYSSDFFVIVRNGFVKIFDKFVKNPGHKNFNLSSGNLGQFNHMPRCLYHKSSANTTLVPGGGGVDSPSYSGCFISSNIFSPIHALSASSVSCLRNVW